MNLAYPFFGDLLIDQIESPNGTMFGMVPMARIEARCTVLMSPSATNSVICVSSVICAGAVESGVE